MIFVSIDGGATKTLAACYSEDGTILGIGVSGPSNFRNVGITKAKANLFQAVTRSLERSGIERNNVSQYSFALAGVKDSKKSTEIIEAFIHEMQLGKNILVLNDGEAGFNCRFPGMDGIVAAPGTGMIAYGRRGNVFERSSGWGWFLGDEGGAFYTAKRALQESSKIFDRRSESNSRLPEAILDYFGVQEARQLVNEVYTEPINIRRIAAFTKIISDYANQGDDLAISLLKESAREAASCVIALKKVVFPDRGIEFSGYGGVYRAGKIYWDTLKDTVVNTYPGMKFKRPLFGYHAVIGSIYLLLNLSNKTEFFDLDGIVNQLDTAVLNVSKEEKKDLLLD